MPVVEVSNNTGIGYNKRRLRIMTQNCCLLPKHVFQNMAEDNRLQRVKWIGELAKRYDLVLFQEVFSTPWASDWLEELKAIKELNLAVAKRGRLKILDSGLVTMSRYPIIEAIFIPFKSNSISNSIIQRGFLHTVLQVGNQRVNAINLHLCPEETHIGFHPTAEYRRRQFHQVLTYKKKLALDNEPWIIGGDFNESKLPLGMEGFEISLKDHQVPTSHQLVEYAVPFPGSWSCIDYLLSNRKQVYSKRVEALISDHYGVECLIEL